MGFKCPICVKDFGRDRTARDKHIRDEHDGTGDDLMQWFLSIPGKSATEKKEEGDSQKPRNLSVRLAL